MANSNSRPPLSSPSPRSAPRTRPSCPSSSLPSRRATSRRTRMPARSGAVASWAPRPSTASRSARRPSTRPSRFKGALQWLDGRGCTYEWRTGIPKPDQGEINCLRPPHMGALIPGFCLVLFFFGSGQLNECHGYPQMHEFKSPCVVIGFWFAAPLRRLLFCHGRPSFFEFDSAFDGPAWGSANKCRDKHRELPERDKCQVDLDTCTKLCYATPVTDRQHSGVHKLSRGAEMSPDLERISMCCRDKVQGYLISISMGRTAALPRSAEPGAPISRENVKGNHPVSTGNQSWDIN